MGFGGAVGTGPGRAGLSDGADPLAGSNGPIFSLPARLRRGHAPALCQRIIVRPAHLSSHWNLSLYHVQLCATSLPPGPGLDPVPGHDLRGGPHLDAAGRPCHSGCHTGLGMERERALAARRSSRAAFCGLTLYLPLGASLPGRSHRLGPDPGWIVRCLPGRPPAGGNRKGRTQAVPSLAGRCTLCSRPLCQTVIHICAGSGPGLSILLCGSTAGSSHGPSHRSAGGRAYFSRSMHSQAAVSGKPWSSPT